MSSNPPVKATNDTPRQENAPQRPRRRLRAILMLLCLLIGIDLLRPPSSQLTAAALVGSIHLYQRTLSPILPQAGVRCRFTPTCSRYGASVIARDGALVGGAKAALRIARCGPWTEAGTVDPP